MSKINEKIEIVYILTELIDEPEWNPNEQDPATFNSLVKNIQEVGLREPVLVCPRTEDDKQGRFSSISGSHRVKAARVAGMTEIPCIVETGFDLDMQKFQNMRFNMIKGKIDPLKFTRLFDELAKKYGEEVTRQMMAFIDKAAFEALYQNVRSSLPNEMKGALDAARKEVKTIDGLAAILNEMFGKYGDTLGKSYMVFSYGGQSHLWIIMDETNKKIADTMRKTAIDTGKDINDVFRELIGQGVAPVIEKCLTGETQNETVVPSSQSTA